jgi:dGTPase
MLSDQVYDVIDATGAALAVCQPKSVDDVRRAPPVVAFGERMRGEGLVLKRFLRANLYRHPQVVETTERGKQVVRELFAAYDSNPRQMPPDYAALPRRRRAIADYIAGMTDRFAIREHERLTGKMLF